MMHAVDSGVMHHLSNRKGLLRTIADGKFDDPVQILISNRR